MCIMTDTQKIRDFCAAGRAVITLQSEKTNQHYTYKISCKDGKTYVKLLTSPDDFTYIGMVKPQGFKTTQASQITESAPSFKAFSFFFDHVLIGGKIPNGLIVRHENRCGKCGRPLTHPESIDSGIGPECAKKMH